MLIATALETRAALSTLVHVRDWSESTPLHGLSTMALCGTTVLLWILSVVIATALETRTTVSTLIHVSD